MMPLKEGEDEVQPSRSYDRDLKLVKLAKRNQQLRMTASAVIEERDRLQKQIDEQAAEVERLRQLADENPQRKEAERYRAELRTMRHKDAFWRAVRAQGADPDVIDDLWTLSGYKADADEPDVSKIAEVAASLKASKARFFGSSEPVKSSSGESPSTPVGAPVQERSEPRPGPASGRGGIGNAPGPNYMKLEDAQDPVKVFGGPKIRTKDDRYVSKFQQDFAKAAEEGRVIYPDSPMYR